MVNSRSAWRQLMFLATHVVSHWAAVDWCDT